VVGVVNKQIKKGLLLSLRVKKIKIGEYLAKLQARAWLSHALCARGQHTAKRQRKCTIRGSPSAVSDKTLAGS